MNKKRAQQILNALKKTSKTVLHKKKFSFSYKSDFLEYKSYLTNFSTEQYQLFDTLFNELEIQDSIRSLLAGDIVNQTENRPALHHQYRCPDPTPEFNFRKICAHLLQKIKKEKYVKLLVGQIACPLPPKSFIRPYDLIITSFPHFVDRLRKENISSEYLKIGFDERIIDYLKTQNLGSVFFFVFNKMFIYILLFF